MPRRKNDILQDNETSYYSMALEQYIADSGKRHTPERLLVLAQIEAVNGRFTISDLEQRLSQSSQTVSRGTIVNTLGVMLEAGLLIEVGVHRRNVLYQLAPRATRKGKLQRIPITISVQCKMCGAIKAVHDRQSVTPLASRRYRGFNPSAGVVTIYGLCDKCNEVNSSTKK